MKTSTFPKLAAFGACLLAVNLGQAYIAGPYTADSYTLHLWHLDETAVPCVDSVASGGTNLVDLATGATLGNPGYVNGANNFGDALNTAAGGTGKGDLLAASPSAGNVTITLADPTTGAFTFEANVLIGFDPTVSGTTTYEIMAGESGSNPNRIFQWRIVPMGFTLISPITATNSPFMTFENVRALSGNQNSIYAPIPTTGPDAIVSNQWYHVAVTYNGQPNTPNNFIMYWTRLDPSRTADDALTINSAVNSLSGLNPLSTVTTTFMLGNQGRSKNGNFLGSIDEVRISKVARGPSGMMFQLPSVSLTPIPNQFVAAGTTVSLTSLASGGVPINYQWQFNNTNITGATAANISGFTNSTLVITNITLAQSGVYTLIATNANSGATNSATVTVGLPLPGLANTGVGANGALLVGGSADPNWQLVQSADATYTGPAAYVDSTIPGTYIPDGPNSQWIAPGDNVNCAGGLYLYQTSFVLDSQNLTNMELIVNWAADNACSDILLNGVDLGITDNNGFTAFFPTIITNNFVAGTNLLVCVVSNAPGSGPNLTAFRAELSGLSTLLPATPVTLLSAPANTGGYEYQAAAFAVTAYGSGPLTYQWFFGTNLLAGQTNRTLIFANLNPSQAGAYTVVITNSVSSTNATATLAVSTPDTLEWQGQTADWDTTTTNWYDLTAQTDVAFSQNLNVLFDDNTTNQVYNVSLDLALTPNSVVVTSSNTYTLGGSGYLTGNFDLFKNGPGTLILDTPNTYSGYTSIQGGTLQVGNNDSSGSLGTSVVTNNAALVVSRGDTALNISSPIHGFGEVSYDGSGAVTVSGPSDYTGGTLINSGIVYAQTVNSFGIAGGGVTVASGGQLYLTANVNLPQPLTLNGVGDGNGAFRKGGAGASTLGWPIILDSDTTISVDGGATLDITNSAGINGTNANAAMTLSGASTTSVGLISGTVALGAGSGGASLIENSAGTWTLTATNNSWTNGTTINSGTLQIGDGGADGSLGSGLITDAGTLKFLTAETVLLTNPVTGGGAFYQSGTGTTVLSGAPLSAFTGSVYVTGTGHLQLAPGEALTNETSLMIGAAQADTSYLALTGGNLVSNVPISIFSRAFINTLTATTPTVNYANIINVSGTNTVSPPSQVIIPSGGNLFTLESDSGYLIFNGGINSAGNGRFFSLQGAASGEVDGPITQNSGDPMSVYKFGAGTWFLNGTSTYSNPTIVSNGTLVVNGVINSSPVTVAVGEFGGSGTLTGPLVINPGATLAPTLATGPATPIGTLTVNNSLTLQAGSFTAMQISAAAATNDAVAGLTSIAYGGTLVVTNISGAPTIGQSFQLFNAGSYAGNFSTTNLPALSSGSAWNWNPANGALSVVSSGPGTFTSPTGITSFSLNGLNIVLTGTNGQAGDAYYLLGSTNLSLPLSQWQVMATNVLGSAGNYTFIGTNAVLPGAQQQFYRLSNTNF
jgi:autotransporter-associated beta strand protein